MNAHTERNRIRRTAARADGRCTRCYCRPAVARRPRCRACQTRRTAYNMRRRRELARIVGGIDGRLAAVERATERDAVMSHIEAYMARGPGFTPRRGRLARAWAWMNRIAGGGP